MIIDSLSSEDQERNQCSLTGLVFKNHYEIKEQIGHGSFGTVFRVVDTYNPNSELIIKVQDDRDQYKRECTILTKAKKQIEIQREKE